jgi:hypothetical protein
MISLLASTTAPKVNTGYAAKIQSDRIENYNSTLCPVWSGVDSYGRIACADSYNTKTAGCSSALDRVVVENYQRPQYAEYTALDASGYLNASALGTPVNVDQNSYQKNTTLLRQQATRENYVKGGRAGYDLDANIKQYTTGQSAVDGCHTGNCKSGYSNYDYRMPLREGYVDTRSNRNFQERRDLSGISNWKSNCYACSAGNR